MSDLRKPSGAEDEYFAREEIKRKEQAKIKLSHQEREKLKQLHWMRCPKCGHTMEEIAFRDMLVDRCTECKGVFFDAPELEHFAGRLGNVLTALQGLFKE